MDLKRKNRKMEKLIEKEKQRERVKGRKVTEKGKKKK